MIDTRGLSLEQAPPFHVPARFFLTAPLFVLLAGLALLWEGPALLASRWLLLALAATHLIAIGYLGLIMCGALLQLVPVVLGVPVPAVRWVGNLCHPLLSFGALFLAGGLGYGLPWALAWGGLASALGFLCFLVPVALALWRAQGEPGTRRALRAAALALLATLLLGLVLSAFLLGLVPLAALTRWVNAHVIWGLLGWVGLLVIGVAIQVIPLFFVTPPYPALARAWLVPLLLAMIILASLAEVRGWDLAAYLALGTAGAGFALFALLTLWLLARRRRRRLDPTLLHWGAAMLALVVALPAWAVGASPMLVGILLLVGVGLGLPAGMLFKILPFLAWFHLQHRQLQSGRFDLRIPHMGSLLAVGWARLQFGLHLLALLLVMAAVFVPVMARPAGLVLVLAGLVLEGLLVSVVMRYRRASRAFLASPVP